MADDLSPASVTGSLDTRFIGQRVVYYPSLASTNEAAKREAQKYAPEGTIVIARQQIAGKGRLKRVWLSPEGSIALSIILYPALAHLSSLVMIASLAVVRSIRVVTGLEAQIKWPNDVLVAGKKVSGILIESRVRGSTVDYAVIGIGVNANLRLSDFPEIAAIATSLSEEMAQDVSLLALTRRVLIELESLYLVLLAGGSVYEDWRDSLVTLGKEVYLEPGGAVCDGIAESVDRDGSLLLRHPDGSLIKIVAGDVTLRHRGCNPPSPC